LLIAGVSVFIAADDVTVVSTMLRPIVGDLGLVLPDDLDDAAWLVNAYLIAFVAVMPLAGRISDLVGRRATFLAAYLVFVAGNVLIPLSPGFDGAFGWFLAGRVLTALGAGAMVPIALAVVADVYPAGRRARAVGTLGAIETLGWVWGPLYGAMLVRFLSWHWQFWLNVPLAAGGLALSWWALAGHARPRRRPPLDWPGAVALTTALVALNVALLAGAEVQAITGFDELAGDAEADLRWLYPVALAAGAAFVWRQRRAAEPLIDPRLLRGRNVKVALAVNAVVGAVLVIAMVDVPIWVNTVEGDLRRAAVQAGWLLAALTAAMAVASYAGGRLSERTWYRPPILAGVAVATAGYAWLGSTLAVDASLLLLAAQLGLIGAGLGLTIAPAASAVVDASAAHQRGAAASVVMVARLLGLSVGLSALTAFGLARFNALRPTVVLPPPDDPGFPAALSAAQQALTTRAIADTFLAAAVVLAVALPLAAAMRRPSPIGGPMDPDADRAPGAPSPAAPHVAAGPVPGAAAPGPAVAAQSGPAGPGPGLAEPAAAAPVPAALAVPPAELAALARRTNLVVGALALLLAAALALMAVLFWRVASLERELAPAGVEAVEAGGYLPARMPSPW
jgi:MFS family permease